MISHGSGIAGAPKAYLNMLVLDRNHNYVTSSFIQVSTSAKENGSDIPHEYRKINPVTIKEPGYAYIYLSNESTTPTEVFFDDMQVMQASGYIVQKDDYYPFGMSFNSYTKPSSTSQAFKFNGKERDEVTGWDDFGARMYMSDLGRWGVIDPMADQMRRYSPYNYAFDNPIRFIDPDGMLPADSRFENYENYDYGSFSILGGNLEGTNDLLGIGHQNLIFPPLYIGSQNDKKDKIYEGGTMDMFTIERTRLDPYVGPSRWRGSGNWASTTLSLMAYDLGTFEPSDLAWQKWAVYGVIGVAAITTSMLQYNDDPFPKPWYTDRPKNYIPKAPEGFNPKRFDGGFPPNNVAKWALIGAGTYKIYKNYKKSIRTNNVHKPALMDKTYVAPSPKLYRKP
ncbi:RHS repeat-associated core domain-containing protein [Echinicola soli]|uniref:RHS repeat-associated core domain-containing protein n=1 Tax=Echinicola soli TaxID=2591634 RepID=A0A514CL67_9BACT|nr:RHS repeat-associated core domain-containing protein [Echinicola soli]QDH80575.1 RHS repeat-associated core domain-containing protein [Echinicola soli]